MRPLDRARNRFTLRLSLLILPAALASCAQYKPFDANSYLRGEYEKRLLPEVAEHVEVPFALSRQITDLLDSAYKPGPNELRRVEQVLDFIFRRIDLKYSLTPTRNAAETFLAREGNCLSFVNLFVGAARYQRLTPFYVEVTDYQRWNHKDGLVVSRGHIVAGMYVKGELKTYDFLPYRPKTYKNFKPIDDLTAAAHYYNNLGAEALLDGRTDDALRHLQVANAIAPHFTKSTNNLGVVYARQGDLDRAMATYQAGLAEDPEDVALLTNLARAYQALGRLDEAAATLAKAGSVNNTNPYFFLYQGEVALASGDHEAALGFMREALRLDSEDPDIHLGLVKLYMAIGDLDKARHHLDRALKLDATDPEARRLALLLGAPLEPREQKP